MKKSITTLALAIAVAFATNVVSQSRTTADNQNKPSPEAKLISKTIQGDQQVCRWLVMERTDDGSNEFTLHYQMNLTQLVSSYGRNSTELKSLHDMLDSVACSDRKQISRIQITGYASPDGPAAANQRLANSRAADMRTYINQHYNLARVAGSTRGVALAWSDTKSAIQSSSMQSKNEALALVSSSHSAEQIETELKRMPAAWDYISRYILPPMRSVEMHVTYTSWVEVVVTTPVGQSAERRRSSGDIYFVVVEQNPSDVVVVDNCGYAPLDYPIAPKGVFKYKINGEKYKERATGRSIFSTYKMR